MQDGQQLPAEASPVYPTERTPLEKVERALNIDRTQGRRLTMVKNDFGQLLEHCFDEERPKTAKQLQGEKR